jgi:hypothetical protein
VYHLFVVRCAQRDALRAYLGERGVATGIHYPVPIHRTEAYAALGLGPGSLPVSEALAGRILSLPLFPGMTAAELDHVVEAVASFGGAGGGVGAGGAAGNGAGVAASGEAAQAVSKAFAEDASGLAKVAIVPTR